MVGFPLSGDAAPRAALDEPVTLAPYDVRWPEAFEAERERIRAALDLPPDAIEHIGSTAVPGMIAKPIIDMMLGVARYPPPETMVSRLLILEFQDLGEAGVAGRRYLKMRERPCFNLHIVERDGGHWARNLQLRNYLRRDAAARERYADAKRAALAQHDHLLAYSAAKQPALAALIDESVSVKDA